MPIIYSLTYEIMWKETRVLINQKSLNLLFNWEYKNYLHFQWVDYLLIRSIEALDRINNCFQKLNLETGGWPQMLLLEYQII